MSDILQDDDFYAKPILNVEGLGKGEIISSLLSIEEYYGKDLFIDNPISSDYVFIEGTTNTVLEVGNSSYNIISAETADVQLAGGNHNIIQISGALDFDQAGGEAVVYLSDTENIDLNIQISSGKLNLIIDDPNTIGEMSITDGFVYFGDARSNIEFVAFEESATSVSITNLVDGNIFELSTNFNPTFHNLDTSANEETSGGDGSNNLMSEDGSNTLLDGSFDSFDDVMESYFDSELNDFSQFKSPETSFDYDAYEKYLSLSGESLDLDISTDFEASNFFYQDLNINFSKVELSDNDITELGLFNNVSPTPGSQLEIDNLIDVDTYADLVWDSALEIFEDT
jgi:hypothetical protein